MTFLFVCLEQHLFISVVRQPHALLLLASALRRGQPALPARSLMLSDLHRDWLESGGGLKGARRQAGAKNAPAVKPARRTGAINTGGISIGPRSN